MLNDASHKITLNSQQADEASPCNFSLPHSERFGGAPRAGEYSVASSEVFASTRNNKLFLIGAGPGDPELLTLKAVRLLNYVDIVFFDNLVDRRILNYIDNPEVETIFSGKGIGESFKQDSINNNILEALKAGKNVARLKGGDPLIFARGIEEAQIAINNGFEVEIIPGLTTALSAAAINKKTLTLRDMTDSITLATGHELNPQKFEFWIHALKSNQVLILYMALRNIVTITDKLKEELGKDFPISAIYKASLIDQKIIDSDLENISQDIINQKFESPVIFYLGKNINHLIKNQKISALQEQISRSQDSNLATQQKQSNQ